MHVHAGHDHAHGHSHSHHHSHDLGAVLKFSTIATLAYVVLCLGAGYFAHSLALVSEAWHNFSDALALVLSWLAVYLRSRPPDSVKTFGYHRAGVLAAFCNAVTLVVISFYIFYESYQRFLAPPKVQAEVMFAVAVAGLLMNSGIAIALFRSAKNDLNIRSSFIHMMGDAAGSVGVLAGALLIRFTGLQAVDPALSVGIGLLILWTSWDIIHEALNILLEGLPRGMTLAQVTGAVKEVPGVLDVHDLHVWTLGPQRLALSCHIRIADIPPSESEQLLKQVNCRLSDGFHIHHTTIQFEHLLCAEPCAAKKI